MRCRKCVGRMSYWLKACGYTDALSLIIAEKTQFASMSQAECDERIAGLNDAIAERNTQIVLCVA